MISNIISERTVLSTFIKNKSIREEYLLTTNKKLFFSSFHQMVFDYIFEVFFAKKEISEDTILSVFSDNTKEIENILFSPEANKKTFEFHIKTLEEAYYNRTILTKIKLIEEQIKNGEKVDVEELLSNIEKPKTKIELKSISTLINNYENQIETMKENSDATGIITIDSKLTISPGDLIVIGARPSMGKTAFTLTVALNKAKKKKTSLIFSLEMPEEKIVGRALSNIGQIPMNEIVKGAFSDYNQYLNAKQKLMDLEGYFYVVDNVNNIDDICSLIVNLKNSNSNLEDVFIDHLGFITTNDSFNGSMHQKIGFITKKLKRTAKAVGVKIWLLSQLNRSLESRENKMPTLSDLRESGSIEEDADIILGLYRDTYYQVKEGKIKEEPIPNPLRIPLLKNRDGATGIVEVDFNGRTMTVKDKSVGQEYIYKTEEPNNNNFSIKNKINNNSVNDEPPTITNMDLFEDNVPTEIDFPGCV
jgi:replicative DNA helicase